MEYGKRARIVAGLMSGTSVDAIDVAITRIVTTGESVDIQVLDYAEYPWSPEERDSILNVSTSDVSAQRIASIDRMVGEKFSDALSALAQTAGIQFDAIGFHGQTIAHTSTQTDDLLPSTLQIGAPYSCARVFGCPVVFDFRRADVLAGGQGAPLVPAADSLMFHREVLCHPIAIQNIGGVGNVTYLAQNSAPIGFDTGPGNMVLDQVMVARTDKLFDKGGEMAAGGLIIPDLLRSLCAWHQPNPPPVSYGREHFGPDFVNRLLKERGTETTADLMATISEWTAMTIAAAFEHLPDIPDRVYIAGGGAKNLDLVARIERLLGKRIQPLNYLGVSSDAREAVAFAVLADARLRGVKFDLRRVTGSQVPQGLGAIALP